MAALRSIKLLSYPDFNQRWFLHIVTLKIIRCSGDFVMNSNLPSSSLVPTTTTMTKTTSMPKTNILIPWTWFTDNTQLKIATKPPPQPKQTTQKTFEQALNIVYEIHLSFIPKPCLKGNKTATQILKDGYVKWLETCKNNLHACLIFPNGAISLSIVAFHEKLQPLWKNLGRWGVTSLDKGYYELSFSYLEDARSVRMVVSWNLNPGLLMLFAWTPDFNPSVQKSTSTHVCFFLLLWSRYWRPKILWAYLVYWSLN